MNTNPSLSPTNLPQPRETIPSTTSDRLFTSLFVLIPLLLVLVYFLILPIFVKPLGVKVELSGDVLVLHVQKLTSGVGGFLVIEKDDAGLPNSLLATTDYLYPGTYKNFEIPIINDGVFDFNYFSEAVSNGKIYVSFRKDKDGDKIFNYKLDSQIVTDSFGKKLRLFIQKGMLEFF